MKHQAHHIQVLLADELDHCKDKEDERIENHIKMIQDTYQESYHSSPQLMTIDKEKQKEGVIQDKEVFLYKLYTISYML